MQVAQRAAQSARLAKAKRLGLVDKPGSYADAPSDLVFTQLNTDPLLPHWDTDMWEQLLRDAGVKHKRLYAARNISINHLLLQGAPLLSVSVLAGHSSVDFTRRRYGGAFDALTDGLAV